MFFMCIFNRTLQLCYFHIRAKGWAINIRRDDLINKSSEYMHKNCKVCSEHFEPMMFRNELKTRLQPTAVPTIVNVSNPPRRVAPARSSPRKRRHGNVSGASTSKRSRTGT